MFSDKQNSQRDFREWSGEPRPYLPRFSRIYEDAARPFLQLDPEESLLKMSELCQLYSFAIPTQSALKNIAAFTSRNKIPGVVEIGAGTGYWARCLKEFGVEVKAYDIDPREHVKAWFPVDVGGIECAARHPGSALMLCCPEGDLPPGHPAAAMASHCLYSYKNAGGKNLIFIGWHQPPSQSFTASISNTGDSAFHAEIAANWRLVASCPLPNWPRWKNSLQIFERAT